MSILKWQVNFISNFASFFRVTTHNSPLSFKLIHFLLSIKGSNESPNFENFLCSGENLPNSSCHFPNHKSVFLQILHGSSVSWNITPLYFFRSNVGYILCTKGTNQSANVVDFLKLGAKFTKFLSFLKQKVSFFSNFTPLFGIIRHISSILFQLKLYILSAKVAHQFWWNFTWAVKVWHLALW